MCVSLAEAIECLPRIQCLFEPLVARYDVNRYPQPVYDQLKQQFRDPGAVPTDDIEAALRWKYARPQPRPLPGPLVKTIRRLADRWQQMLAIDERDHAARIESLKDPEQPANDFVSRAFLVHLVTPKTVPIIDRYNHRAVRWYLGTVRNEFALGGLPQQFDDLELIRSFMHQVIAAWGKNAPNMIMLDRFLMVFGKNVAPQY